MSDDPMTLADTTYGFEWGPMEVSRLFWEPKAGRLLQVKTEHAQLQVWVSTKGRKIRAFSNGKELK